MRHISKEAGCWVISAATAMHVSDLPDDFAERERLFDAEERINDGNSAAVKPMGAVIASRMIL